MTIIVGLVEDGEVWMGADRRGSWGRGGEIFERGHPKIGVERGILMGLGGNGSIRDPLQFWEWNQLYESDFCYSWNQQVPAVLEYLDGYRCGERDDDGDLKAQVEVLLGHKGHLYLIDGSLTMTMLAGPFAAIGTGDRYAMGALFTMSAGGMPTIRHPIGAETKLLIAMRAAAAHRGDCGGRFDVFRESMSRPVLDGVR